jgi:hypothetical protein
MLKCQWIIEDIQKKSKVFWKSIKMKTPPTRTYWTQKKTVLRGKFIAKSTYIKNTERSQRKDLILHLKLLEKQEEIKPK